MSENVFELLLGGADIERAAILDEAGGISLTRGALLEQSGRVANALISLGVQPGDRVAAQVEKSVSALALYLGTLRAGAVFLPLNTGYTLNELRHFVDDAEPKLVVCAPSAEKGVRDLLPAQGVVLGLDARGTGSFAELTERQPSQFDTVPRSGEDLAAILYTSGTTGRSKGAMLSHSNLASNAEVLRSYWRFSDQDVLIHALPIYHTHGLFVAANLALLTRCPLYFLPKFDADLVVELMPRATALMGVPTHYTRLLTHPKLPDAARTMRLFTSGSAPLRAEDHHAWKALTGHAILERYGMTETNMLTSNSYEGDRLAGSVGHPLPGVDLRIADPETGAVLPANEIGVIEVKGAGVFGGYWRMPERNATDFRPDGYFITGDLGKIDERNYVWIIGREKDLVISGGLNVYPREVESEIDTVPGVLESAVIGLDHADLGEAVTAVVVREPAATVSESDIVAALSTRLSKFKQPKRVLFVEELPRNAMGKVQKNILRSTHAGLYQASAK